MTILYKANGNVEFSPEALRKLATNQLKTEKCKHCTGTGHFVTHIDGYMSVSEVCDGCKGLGVRLRP